MVLKMVLRKIFVVLCVKCLLLLYEMQPVRDRDKLQKNPASKIFKNYNKSVN